MDWLILILGVPAILIPLVLLFGFAGCTPAAEACIDDSECPAGLVCFQNACVSADTTSPPPSPPDSLTANARDDQSVSLTWTEADPAVTDFEIERIPEAGEPGERVVFAVQANLSPTGAASATDASSDLQEGVTYIYRVRAVLGEQHSDFSPSEGISATVFPAAPRNLVATPVSVNQIDLSWTNASATATDFSIERRAPGGAFGPIFRVRDATTYSDSDPSLGNAVSIPRLRHRRTRSWGRRE